MGNHFQVKVDIIDKLTDFLVVFVHDDFAMTNILFDNKDHIIDIINWKLSKFLSFDRNFYDIDLFLDEIIYHNDKFNFANYKARIELKMIFWHTFWSDIVAVLADRHINHVEA